MPPKISTPPLCARFSIEPFSRFASLLRQRLYFRARYAAFDASFRRRDITDYYAGFASFFSALRRFFAITPIAYASRFRRYFHAMPLPPRYAIDAGFRFRCHYAISRRHYG
jgi:hypothetical protein